MNRWGAGGGADPAGRQLGLGWPVPKRALQGLTPEAPSLQLFTRKPALQNCGCLSRSPLLSGQKGVPACAVPEVILAPGDEAGKAASLQPLAVDCALLFSCLLANGHEGQAVLHQLCSFSSALDHEAMRLRDCGAFILGCVFN